MFLLKKLFKLRDSAGGQSAEKPFLDHLEDLRDMIIRIVLTLILSTVLCYIFKDTLLEVLRRPIEQVWQKSEKSKLPQQVSPELWEKAKLAANRVAGLSEAQRQHFYAQFEDERLRYFANCATYYRLALVLDDPDQRTEFIQSLPDLLEEEKTTISELLEKNPSDALDARGDVVLMRSLRPTETFMLAIKLSLFAGIVISFPLILLFVLQFVLPGLKENERKAVWPAMLVGFGLFLAGVFFCYFEVLPRALEFFFSFGNDMGVENEWRIGEYISFATQFTLIFGLAFELPVVVMTLVKIGLLSYETMRNTRSYAILAIIIVAAVITPTGDALTLMMLATPMYLLYEICIWLACMMHRKDIEQEALEEEEMRKYYESHKQDEDAVSGHASSCQARPDESNTGFPKVVPVQGRIAAGGSSETHHGHDDHYLDDQDYHEGFEDDHAHYGPNFDADEGLEEDDGVVEESDSSAVFTDKDEELFDAQERELKEKQENSENRDDEANGESRDLEPKNDI